MYCSSKILLQNPFVHNHYWRLLSLARLEQIVHANKTKNKQKKKAKENQQYLINTMMTLMSQLCSLIPFFSYLFFTGYEKRFNALAFLRNDKPSI